MVAVKVIEHSAGVRSKIEAVRETLVSSNIHHPNIVSTYKVITCVQRSMLTGQPAGRVGDASGIHSNRPTDVSGQAPKAAVHSVGSSGAGLEDLQACLLLHACIPAIALVQGDIPLDDEPPRNACLVWACHTVSAAKSRMGCLLAS